MKAKVVSLVAALPLMAAVALPSTALSNESSQQSIEDRTQSLEKEIQALKKEVRHMKHQQGGGKELAKGVYEKDYKEGEDFLKDFFYRAARIGGTPVVTSPYIGIRSRWDGMELVTNQPAMNEDLRMLKQRSIIETELRKKGLEQVEHAVIDLSGKLEAFASARNGYNAGPINTEIDLNTAELDFFAAFNRWSTGFMSVAYDSSAPALAVSGQRSSNSRFFLDKGFMTLGSLNDFPLYFTVGQLVVPFGQYSTHALSSISTNVLGKTKARAIVLGYQQPGNGGFNVAGYLFRGDSRMQDHGYVNNGGISVTYAYDRNDLHSDWGAGVIYNIADSNGFQANGNPAGAFMGFGATVLSEKLVDHIPGFDIYGRVNVGQFFSMGAEYVTALDEFNAANLTFNGDGAQPRAVAFEMTVNFPLMNRPAAVSFDYNYAAQALALNVPKHSFFGILNTAIWKDTIESIEYRHDINYSAGSTATGTDPSGTTVLPVPTAALGRTRDTVVFQIGFYF